MAEFTWHYDYTLSDLLFRQVRLLVYRVVAFAALLGSVALWIVFVAASLPVLSRAAGQVFLPPAPGARYFWLGVLLTAYAWYRLERERAWYPKLSPAALQVQVDKHLAEETWRVLTQAFRYAHRLRAGAVEPVHILAAALRYRTGQRLFSRLGVPRDKLTATLRNELVLVGQGSAPRLAAESQAVFREAARRTTDFRLDPRRARCDSPDKSENSFVRRTLAA